MSELDIVALQAGLERAHGLEAVYLSDKSSTALIHMVDPSGLPMHVGWFDNSRKTLAGPDVYALTSRPAAPRNMHHRLILAQHPGADFGVLTEEDSAAYLEGDDDLPTIMSTTHLEQPAFGRTIRARVVGAYVLTADTGHDLDHFGWTHEYQVAEVRAHGRALIEAGNYLAQIDNAMLNGFTTPQS